MKKIAIVYTTFSHYRLPVIRLLCNQAESVEYTFISDPKNTISSVKVIDPSLAEVPIDQGGVRWEFIRNIRLFNNFIWQKGVVNLAFNKEYDTIIYIGVVYHLSTWFSCALARLMGKKTLMWSHGFLRDEKGLKGMIRKSFYKLADGMLLYGNRSRNIMIKKGFEPKKLYVVYNSLNYDMQYSIRERINSDQLNKLKKNLFPEPVLPILFFIGRINKVKKLDMILKSADLLNKKGIKVNILFIGDGTEREKLTQLSKYLGLADRVVFYGACYEEEKLAPLIMMSDICVSPGNVGLTAMHSLVYGRPVITSNDYDSQMPEFEAIKSGVTGDFFQKDDVGDMAEVIYSWLNTKRSRKGEVEKACHEEINQHYNPWYTVKIINTAVMNI